MDRKHRLAFAIFTLGLLLPSIQLALNSYGLQILPSPIFENLLFSVWPTLLFLISDKNHENIAQLVTSVVANGVIYGAIALVFLYAKTYVKYLFGLLLLSYFSFIWFIAPS